MKKCIVLMLCATILLCGCNKESSNESQITTENTTKEQTTKKEKQTKEQKTTEDVTKTEPETLLSRDKNTYNYDITYEMLAREPKKYYNKAVKFTGTITQNAGVDDEGYVHIRINVNDDYNCNLYVTYEESILDFNLLENDNITIYGGFVDLASYTSIFGNEITVPYVHAVMIDLNNQDSDSETAPITQQTTQKPTDKPTEKPVSVSDMQVIEEFTYCDGFWCTYHFVVIKNNSNKPVTISTSTLAYKNDGTLISVSEGYVDIVGPGCTTIYYEAFETTEEISSYDTEMTVDTDVWYECGLNGLTYKQSNIEDGAIFQVTNNGNKAVNFVQGYALFLKDGKIVGWESDYFTDDDYEIKAGKTISKQFSIYEEYDEIKFYLTGRID